MRTIEEIKADIESVNKTNPINVSVAYDSHGRGIINNKILSED